MSDRTNYREPITVRGKFRGKPTTLTVIGSEVAPGRNFFTEPRNRLLVLAKPTRASETTEPVHG